jgi:hypothetical protein
MAIVMYKVHVEELAFPYRRELVDVFPSVQYDDVMNFVERFNSDREHIWGFKLEVHKDDSIMEEPPTKIISAKFI